MMSTLSIDPGGVTGCAVRTATGEIVTFTLETMTREGKRVVYHPTLLSQLINDTKPDRVVYEDFGAETISGYGIHTVRLCGLIIGVCDLLSIPVIRHMPMERKPYMDEAKTIARAQGKTVVHEWDALAHLLRCEADNGK